MTPATEADVVRFMSHVEVLSSGCWYWTGARSRGRGNRRWYGSFWYGGRTVRAHRFACEVIAGEHLPSGHHRDHLCGFSMCVRPDHLQVVTREVNQARKESRRWAEQQTAALRQAISDFTTSQK